MDWHGMPRTLVIGEQKIITVCTITVVNSPYKWVSDFSSFNRIQNDSNPH